MAGVSSTLARRPPETLHRGRQKLQTRIANFVEGLSNSTHAVHNRSKHSPTFEQSQHKFFDYVGHELQPGRRTNASMSIQYRSSPLADALLNDYVGYCRHESLNMPARPWSISPKIEPIRNSTRCHSASLAKKMSGGCVSCCVHNRGMASLQDARRNTPDT